ncbi:Tetratricopeptide repeat-containing protein [Methylomagnum ishizawai]|uniref:Tetratricopeptide repeat-containing protein n=1 Tax=Methylomagnum ishizawai TaxID=1760988 RepID=A0A1Y6CZY5_9GAMM|nr:alkaline phosphatase family protein [Methylomagnum ishizawai]SMF96248.1 Tetratricopeptide repeat-containing protein [Methylomagnum ishizawai]
MAPKVLLIGWDAADWKVISPLMDAGKMPNLEKFVSQGVMGNLSTLYPVLSPMLWTSIATGKRAYKHGIHGFAEPDPKSGSVRPVTNLGRKCKALWNILHQQGLKSNVVGWWPSHPAEPIDGVMVSNHYQQVVGGLDQPWPMRPGTVHPPHLADPLAEFRVHTGELDPEILLSFVPRAAEIDQGKDRRLSILGTIIAENASIHAAATALMQLEPWDFMGVYYDGIDHFCHGFMKYHPPRLDWVPEEDFELYREVVNAGYQFHDLMLGTLLHLAGEDTTVIIVSDHGFHPDHLRPKELPNEPAGPAEEHRDFGIIAMKGPGLKRDQLIYGASLLDVTPTILSLYGLPLGRDMDGKPLLNAFAAVPEVEYIESWDSLPGDAGMHPPGMQTDPVDETEALKQLVKLGYIEKLDEDRETALANTIKELRYNLARDLFDAKQLVEAARSFEELWNEFPDESRFGVKLLECHLGLSRPKEARVAYERLFREKQRYAAVALEELQKLSQEWKDKNFTDLTEDQQTRIGDLRRKASFNNAVFPFLLALVYMAEQEYDLALVEFTKAEHVQLHNRPSLYLGRAKAYMALGRWREAEACLNEVLAIDPVNPAPRLGLARCHLHSRRPRKALEEALASIGMVFHNPLAHYVCGRALVWLGRKDEAITALQTALAQNPVYPAAHSLLADIYRSREQFDKAAEHRALAKAAEARIAAYLAGEPLPDDVDLKLDLDMHRAASVADLSVLEALPPLGRDIVVVSGLPRSGTSMAMQMLAAGGVSILTDGERVADESNPRGYYELERVKQLVLNPDNTWLDDAQGKAVKIIAPLLDQLPMGHVYRIVFMERPLKEIVASQAAMLKSLGQDGARLSERQLAAAYLKQVDNVRAVLAAHPDRVSVLSIGYHEALHDSLAVATQINRFLGGGLDEAAMAAAVDASLYRQRADSAAA